jgi:hypothetical protein
MKRAERDINKMRLAYKLKDAPKNYTCLKMRSGFNGDPSVWEPELGEFTVVTDRTKWKLVKELEQIEVKVCLKSLVPLTFTGKLV